MAKTITHTQTLKGSPHEVYEVLMDSAKHAQLIGHEATISREVGGKFVVFGGSIEGQTMELEPDSKIVQKWRAGDFPEGHYSTAIFELKEANGGTELIFTQTDVPDEKFDDISEGWQENYWEKLNNWFEK